MTDKKTVSLGGKADTAEPVIEKAIPSVESIAAANNIPQDFIDREFIVPVDVVKLPSNGILYGNKQKTVKIKELTAEDEDILMTPELIKSGRVLDVLLEQAVVETGIPVEKLLIGDRNKILLELSKTGFGEIYKVDIGCISCGEAFSERVNLSKLESKPCDLTPDGNGEFDVKLPKRKSSVKFRFLTGEDERRIMKMAEAGKKSAGNTLKISKVLTERYTVQIMEVDGERDKTYIRKFVRSMPISDSLFLREYIREIEPGIDLNYSFECEHCGNVFDAEVPITARLFWPNARV